MDTWNWRPLLAFSFHWCVCFATLYKESTWVTTMLYTPHCDQSDSVVLYYNCIYGNNGADIEESCKSLGITHNQWSAVRYELMPAQKHLVVWTCHYENRSYWQCYLKPTEILCQHHNLPYMSPHPVKFFICIYLHDYTSFVCSVIKQYYLSKFIQSYSLNEVR